MRGIWARRMPPDGKTAFTLELGSDAFFDRVRMLEPGELNGEAVVEMTNNPPRNLAEGNDRADFRPECGRHSDAGARQRDVDDAAADHRAVRQQQGRAC